MSPKKAIIILLIATMALAVFFLFLYVKIQIDINGALGPVNQNSNVGTGIIIQHKNKLTPTSSRSFSPTPPLTEKEQKLNSQINFMISQGKTKQGGLTEDARNQIKDTINAAIEEQLNQRTSAQVAADKKKADERQKLENDINKMIKNQLNNKPSANATGTRR